MPVAWHVRARLLDHRFSREVEGAAGGLSAESHNGSIDIATEAPKVELVTHNGGIKAHLSASGPLEGKIHTHNGSVRLTFEEGVSADLDCRTRNGSVSINDTVFQDVWEKRGRRKHVTGRLGSGGSELKIETTNGSISLDID